MRNNEWKNVRLKEIANITMGQSPKSSYYNEEGVGMPFMQGRTTFGEKYHTIERYTTKVTRSANKNSVLMSVRAPVGDVNIAVCDLCIGRGLASLEMKNGNNEFLYYLLKANHEYINSGVSGTVFSSINKSGVEELEFNIPDDKTQRKISSILTSIDSKIEINNQINEKLEETAKAIYNEWFVNFNFPDENGLPYKDNGGEFYETELGKIPVGWEVVKLGDLLNLRKESVKAGTQLEDEKYLPIECIPMKQMFLNEFKSGYEAKSSLIKFYKDDILLGAMRAYFHRVIIAPFDGITRTTCFVLTPNNSDYLAYLYLCLYRDESIQFANSTSKGTTIPYAVWENGLDSLTVCDPEIDIVKEFNELLSPIFDRFGENLYENIKLNQLKNLLLNKLMSGQIDVEELDIDWDKLSDTLNEVEEI